MLIWVVYKSIFICEISIRTLPCWRQQNQEKSLLFMESNVKFPVYSSYIFELLFKNKLFNYISRTNYYISQSIGSYYIYCEQVFIRLQQSNLHIHIWLIFDELCTKIGYISDISISVCCSAFRVCFCSPLYQQFHQHT